MPKLPGYRNQSIGLQIKSNDWFLYGGNLGVNELMLCMKFKCNYEQHLVQPGIWYNYCVKQPYADILFSHAYDVIKKKTATRVFSCEFWEIFKNTFLTEQFRPTASGSIMKA